MTDLNEEASNKKPNSYARLKVTGVQLLLLLRILEDSLRYKDSILFAYTYEFREELYNDIIGQQDKEFV
jgi:hypothetical protein